jgi:DNA repair photolyase
VDRIEAARKVSDAGYETRIRIDPMVPVFEWDKHYTGLVDKIYLKSNYDFSNVALCKETIEMWEKIGLDFRKIRFNCMF